MIAFNVGRRRRGKTTLSYYLARKAAKRCVFDPRGQIQQPASVLITAPSQLDDAYDALQGTSDVQNATDELVFVPTEDVQDCFDQFCILTAAYVAAYPTHRVALLVDEARFVDTKKSIAFDRLLRFSPPSLDIILTAHRPADISPDVRGILDYWCIFQCTQEHDLKVIDERCGAEIAREVRSLDAYQWIQWDDGDGVATKHLDPAVWFVPLSTDATPAQSSALSGLSGTPFDRPRLF